jgi:hypothetical protein
MFLGAEMPGDDPLNTFNDERSLTEARQFIELTQDELVIIKIRPVQKVGTFNNAWMSDGEYKDIYAALDKYNVIREGNSSEGKVKLIELSPGNTLLFVKHEHGPELIFALDLITHAAKATGAVAAAGTAIIGLINAICRIINKDAHARNSEQPSNRITPAEGISLEKHLVKGAKALKQLKIVSDSIGVVVTKISDLM